MGTARLASACFPFFGLTVNHIPVGGEPPMSNRVVALNSFVPPVRTVASALLQNRVVALMDNIVTDLPALFYKVVIEGLHLALTLCEALPRCVPCVRDISNRYSNQINILLYCYCFTTWEDRATLRSDPSARVGLKGERC